MPIRPIPSWDGGSDWISPTVEAMRACILSPTECKANYPHDGEYDRSDPQQMHRKPGTKQNQNEQQSKNQNHFDNPSRASASTVESTLPDAHEASTSNHGPSILWHGIAARGLPSADGVKRTLQLTPKLLGLSFPSDRAYLCPDPEPRIGAKNQAS